MAWPRFAAWVLLGGGLVFSKAGLSLGLGEIAVSSHLGESFRARIPVSASEQEKAGLEKCFRLGGVAGGGNDVPLLRRARIDYRESNGKSFLIITGFHALNDPILRVAVSGCNNLYREYFVFLDPKSAQEPDIVQSEAPQAAPAPRRAVTARKTVRAKEPPRRAAATEAAGETPPPPRQPRRAPVVSKPGYRLEISAPKTPLPPEPKRSASEEAPVDENLHLRLTPELSNSGTSTLSPQDIELLRQKQRLLASPDAQADAVLALQAQLKQNNEQIAALRKEMEDLRKKNEIEAKAAQQAREAAENNRKMMLLMGAGGVVAILLGAGFGIGWWRQRKRYEGTAAGGVDAFTAARFPDTIPTPSPVPPAGDTIPVLNEVVRVPAPPVKPVAPPPPPPPPVAKPAVVGPPKEQKPIFVPPAAPQKTSWETNGIGVEIQGPIESAELLIAIGEAEKAIELLDEAIQHQADTPVDVWLKLLVIYRQFNRRLEFEALAIELHRRYNVKAPSWEKTPDHAPVPQKLAEFPHLMDRITKMWGTTECLDFLNDLLKDSREGARIGFSISVVRELRALIRQLEKGLGLESEHTASGLSAKDERILMNEDGYGHVARSLPEEGAPLEKELAVFSNMLEKGRKNAEVAKVPPPAKVPALDLPLQEPEETPLPVIDFVLPDIEAPAAPSPAKTSAPAPVGKDGLSVSEDGGMTWEAFAAVLDTHEQAASDPHSKKKLGPCTSHLEERYPRVIEKLVLTWGHPEIEKVIEGLLLDDRGNRQGFDKEAMADLMLLGAIVTMFSRTDSPWADIPAAKRLR